VLSKYTIVGLIVGIIISALGIFSAIDYFTNPIEIMDFNDNFGVGESTIFQFESPENSLQKLMITGDSFDVKILTPGNKEKFMIVTRIKQICHGLVLQEKTLLKFKTLVKAN